MEQRTVLHCDLNNYFASVESIGHPEYTAVPMAVCGSVEERHGIVLAKNEKAKALGIKTAMTVVEAQRICPDLLMLPPHYDRYMEYSRKVQEVYRRYTDQVEPFGIDECWLDVTGSTLLFGSGVEIARAISRQVEETFGLTISVGVSFCKVMAKLGSDMEKPRGITAIKKEDLPQKVWGLPVGELFGVGRHTVEKLGGLGVFTIGQLANTPVEVLQARFGKNGVQLWQFANGLECSPVRRFGETDPPKSVGRSTTCRVDLHTKEQVRRVLVGLAEQVSAQLRKNGLWATVVHLYLRDTHLIAGGHQQKLSIPTRLVPSMVNTAMELLDRFWNGTPLRSVGISAGGLIAGSVPVQTGLFYDVNRLDKGERLEAKVDEIRQTMGEHAVERASQMLTPLHVKLGSSFGHVQF